jgi:hypothetical protein
LQRYLTNATREPTSKRIVVRSVNEKSAHAKSRVSERPPPPSPAQPPVRAPPSPQPQPLAPRLLCAESTEEEDTLQVVVVTPASANGGPSVVDPEAALLQPSDYDAVPATPSRTPKLMAVPTLLKNSAGTPIKSALKRSTSAAATPLTPSELVAAVRLDSRLPLIEHTSTLTADQVLTRSTIT